MSNKTVEEKLALYRLRKDKEKFPEERFSHFKKTVNFFNDGINRFYRLILPDSNIEDKLDAPTEKLLKSENTECHSSNEIENIEFEQEDQEVLKSAKNDNKFDWIVLILKVALWLILWKIFILLEFGAVYFVCSCFLFIWLNLYSGSKRKGPSAYSVFNPNCEHIMGSYTAEKLEKELLHR
ncbi:SAYSvFN domain-containing protein 1 [Armadillidium nasatum]|nr:SAYSvFN domain-containing protein 1 [Armadillidium nasatum]